MGWTKHLTSIFILFWHLSCSPYLTSNHITMSENSGFIVSESFVGFCECEWLIKICFVKKNVNEKRMHFLEWVSTHCDTYLSNLNFVFRSGLTLSKSINRNNCPWMVELLGCAPKFHLNFSGMYLKCSVMFFHVWIKFWWVWPCCACHKQEM